MNIIKNILLEIVLPIMVIIIFFEYNTIYGIVAILIFLAYQVYRNKPFFLAFKGNIAYSNDQIEKATDYFKRASECKKVSPKFRIYYGYLLLKSGNIDEAYNVFNKLINTRDIPKNIKMDAKSNMALVYWKQNKIDEAILLFEEVFKDYKNTTIYGSLGYMLILKGDLDKALEFNLEAFDYNGEDKVILDNLGQNYYLLGQYEKAYEIYKKLISLSPSFAEAYYNYGLLLEALEKYEEALSNYKKASEYSIYALSMVTKEQIEEKIDKLSGIIEKDKEDNKEESLNN